MQCLWNACSARAIHSYFTKWNLSCHERTHRNYACQSSPSTVILSELLPNSTTMGASEIFISIFLDTYFQWRDEATYIQGFWIKHVEYGWKILYASKVCSLIQNVATVSISAITSALKWRIYRRLFHWKISYKSRSKKRMRVSSSLLVMGTKKSSFQSRSPFSGSIVSRDALIDPREEMCTGVVIIQFGYGWYYTMRCRCLNSTMNVMWSRHMYIGSRQFLHNFRDDRVTWKTVTDMWNQFIDKISNWLTPENYG